MPYYEGEPPELTGSSHPSDTGHDFEVFPWSKNFNTGHPVIDDQHRKLVDLLNRLTSTLVVNDQAEVESAFKQLAEYADYHFKSEEKIWAAAFGDDEWFRAHQRTHASFLPKVLEIKNQDSSQNGVVEVVVKFLIRWLAFHIVDDDKRLALVIADMDQGIPLEEAKANAKLKMADSSVRTLIETVLGMYDRLSTRTLNLLRERRARLAAEKKLKLANAELEAANKRLAEMSVRDELTGLYNRRHFEAMLQEELNRSIRSATLLNLMTFDIDHFKRLNDHYGHPAGDQALRSVGNKLTELCRRSGEKAFRIGGEEFAVLISAQSTEEAVAFANNLREQVLSLSIPNKKSDAHPFMTISGGLVSLKPSKQATLERIYSLADEALYEAKNSGRNKIVICPESALH